MTTSTAVRDPIFDLPNDGRRRWIVGGQIKDWGYEDAESEKAGMTIRNRTHCRILMTLGRFVGNWIDDQAEPHGYLVGGECGIRLPGLDSTVGVDMAYIQPELAAEQEQHQSTLIVGVPQLIVEILSPSDTEELVDEMIEVYRNAGVPRVWIVSPGRRQLIVNRPDGQAKLYLPTDTLTDDLFPGLSLPLSRVFV